MACFEARMSSKGQVTLPIDVRRFLGLQEGDRVDFYVDAETRSVRVIARNGKLSDLQGLLEGFSDPRRLSPGDVDAAIGDHLVAEDERIGTSWTEMREFQEWRRSRSPRAAE